MKTAAKYVTVLLLAAMLLCGCFEKSFENKNITFKGASDFDVCVDETKILTVQLPDNGVKTSLSAVVDKEGLSIEVIDNNEIKLKGSAVGEYNITFTLSAKGYKSADAVFTANVLPKELPVSIVFDGEEFSDEFIDGYSLNYGQTVELELKHDIKNTELNLSTPDNSVIEISGSGNKYSITGISAGGATLYISTPLPEYRDLSLPIKVEKIKAELTLSSNRTVTTVGNTAVVECHYPSDSYIEVSSIPQQASVDFKDSKITVTSSIPGEYNITVWCKGENYIAASQNITAVFSLPKISFSAPSSLTLRSGTDTEFLLSGYPAGTSFSAVSGGKAAVSVFGNRITVTAKAAGNDTITVTASNPGYQSSSVKIPVTINAVSVKVSSKYNSQINDIIQLINKERTARGYSALSYLDDLAPACTIRAKESSEKWSHTRPGGANWETALYDTGVRFKSGGENLLEMNALNAAEAVNAWMASPGHKENILRPNFNATCVAIYKDGENYYYAQHFIER